MTRKTVAFLPSHPAQLWLMRPVADAIASFANVRWVLRDKDVSLALARDWGLEFTLLSTAQRGLIANACTLAADVVRCSRLGRRLGVGIWVTKYGAAHIAARLKGCRGVAFNDDDADVVPFIAWTAYPFAHTVLAPTVTRMGRFAHKTRRFEGNFELFYLHPNRFTPDAAVRGEMGLANDEPFGLVRLSALAAHHDVGVRGIGEHLLREIVRLTRDRMRLFISSEKPLSAEFEPLRFPIAPTRIHHALAFAEFLIGDSQTMNSEAAVLGTPAFRLSSFVGRLSYLDELERYGLSFGFLPGRESALVTRLSELLADSDRQARFEQLRQTFLADKGDPLPWFVEQIREELEQAGASSPSDHG